MTQGHRTIILWLAPAATLAVIGIALLTRMNTRTTHESRVHALAQVPSPVEPRRVGTHAWVVSARDRDAYLRDFAKAMNQLVLQLHAGKEADSVTDLSILAIAKESPMYEAGFRKDGRILRVNGTPIRTMGRAANLVHEIKACERLSVGVRRGDQVIDYQFDFR